MTMMTGNVSNWVVEFTLPPDGGARTWTSNHAVSVFTTGARRAMDLIEKEHPDCTVIVVRKASKGQRVLVDPDALAMI